MNGHDAKSGSVASVTPGSPATKRKPVPTPRSTLRKPTPADEQARKKVIIINGIDSQGHSTSGESASPDDVAQHNGKTGGEDSEDILAALEKIPSVQDTYGVGSMRSLYSVGSSQPSLTLDAREKMRREESSHSISSGLSLGLISERKRSLGERSRTSPRILLLNGKNKVEDKVGSGLDARSDVTDTTNLSSPTSLSGQGTKVPIPRGAENRRSLKSVKIQESDIMPHSDSSAVVVEDKAIQHRPLPEIPPTTKVEAAEADDIEVISNSEEIYTALLTPPGESEDHYQELKPTPSNLQTPVRVIVQKIEQKYSNNETAVSLASLNSNDIKSSNYLTMTGTIKRGRYPEKNIDIQLSVTPDHLSKLEKRVQLKYHDRCFCGLRRGPHVFLISLLSIPFMLIYSAFQAFFLGSMTWYNIFLHYNEERTCCHKLLSPFVLLFYPIWIVPVTLGLCLYGGIRCISWYWDSYWNEITNPDSGFCHWICEQLNLPDCSPYQVVLLSADSENGGSPAQPSPQNV